MTQNMLRVLARFWFSNANWDHGENVFLKNMTLTRIRFDETTYTWQVAYHKKI